MVVFCFRDCTDADQLNIFFERLCFEFQMKKIFGSDLLLKFFEPTTSLSGILKWLKMILDVWKDWLSM